MILSNSKIDVNNPTSNMLYPLFVAAKKGNALLVKQLLEKGADYKIKSTFRQQSVLHAAIHSKDKDCVRIFLNLQANPTEPDAIGVTPIHIAAEEGDI